MTKTSSSITLLSFALVVTSLAIAQDDPRHDRHELMEEVRDAAKPVGQMMRGDAEFDAEVVAQSLQTMLDASQEFGGLFPPGSEGGDSRAAPAIWEDRAGFDAALAEFDDAVEAAVTAEPSTLEEARPVLGPVFKSCSNCHDSYRLEEDD